MTTDVFLRQTPVGAPWGNTDVLLYTSAPGTTYHFIGISGTTGKLAPSLGLSSYLRGTSATSGISIPGIFQWFKYFITGKVLDSRAQSSVIEEAEQALLLPVFRAKVLESVLAGTVIELRSKLIAEQVIEGTDQAARTRVNQSHLHGESLEARQTGSVR